MLTPPKPTILARNAGPEVRFCKSAPIMMFLRRMPCILVLHSRFMYCLLASIADKNSSGRGSQKLIHTVIIYVFNLHEISSIVVVYSNFIWYNDSSVILLLVLLYSCFKVISCIKSTCIYIYTHLLIYIYIYMHTYMFDQVVRRVMAVCAETSWLARSCKIWLLALRFAPKLWALVASR